MALTALDFPASPTVGQLYPDPPVTGQPQYSWNGTQWLSSKAAVSPDRAHRRAGLERDADQRLDGGQSGAGYSGNSGS